MDKEPCETVVKESDMKKPRQENVVNGWEKLSSDILMMIILNYFTIHEFTTSGIAHVCRDWRAVCCDPALWAALDLSFMRSIFIPSNTEPYLYVMRRSDKNLTRILKRSMSLSKGNIRSLICNANLYLSDDMLTYTAKRCPNLRRLVLPAWNRIKESTISNVISCFKHLESLTMPSVQNPHFVFSSIVKKRTFRELKVMGPVDLFFAQNLVQHLPNLKVLSLRCTAIHIDALLIILDKLQSLEFLNIAHSYLVVDQEHPENKKIIVRELDKLILEKVYNSKLEAFITCMAYEVCELCQLTEKDEGFMRWYMYPDDVWKEDEVSSLQLL